MLSSAAGPSPPLTAWTTPPAAVLEPLQDPTAGFYRCFYYVDAAATEPSCEPCGDEIPWADLVFWLGDAATGQVDACSCAACRAPPPVAAATRRSHLQIRRLQQRRVASAPYSRLSAKIPVINLPRIEGVNSRLLMERAHCT